jgi:hypothetical protein
MLMRFCHQVDCSFVCKVKEGCHVRTSNNISFVVVSCKLSFIFDCPIKCRGCSGHDCMVVWLTSTLDAISAYHHKSCEFGSCSCRDVLNTTICDKVCHWLAAGRWFIPGIPVSSTNKTDSHDITEILLKVVLNTIILTLKCKKVKYIDQSDNSSWCVLSLDT